MRIAVLDDLLVDQIAAGEVVERPASVVKELVENAIDAEASDILVQLRAGGRTLVRVVDDGIGMDREDALLCIQRHATSKIRTADDLGNILSLGFRGEALPSIASVSRFTLTTRTREAEVATRVVVDGGELGKVGAAGAPVGTEIDVRSLFYNLPVRRKFLRAAGTELGHCVEAVVRPALVNPQVGFILRHEERELISAPAVETRAERAEQLLGAQGKALLPVAFEDDGVQVEGHISPPGVHRSTRTGAVYLYVNGRFVRDAVVHRALAEAYRGLVPKGRHPVVVLEIRVDPGMVDVNVHPNKVEVRFVRPREVVRAVSEGVRRALESYDAPAPKPVGDEPERPTWTPVKAPAPALPLDVRRPAADSRGGRSAAPAPRAPVAPSLSPHPTDDPRFARPIAPPLVASPATNVVREERPAYRAVVPRFRELALRGPLGSRFLLCDHRGDLVLIDRPAAQESVMLHQLRAACTEGLGASQGQLAPQKVAVPLAHAEVLEEHLELLAEVGLALEPEQGTRFALRAVPSVLERADVELVLREISAALAVEGRAHDARETVLRVLARHAVRLADDELSTYQQQALLASLDEVAEPVGLDGRPVAVRVGRTELERRFEPR